MSYLFVEKQLKRMWRGVVLFALLLAGVLIVGFQFGNGRLCAALGMSGYVYLFFKALLVRAAFLREWNLMAQESREELAYACTGSTSHFARTGDYIYHQKLLFFPVLFRMSDVVWAYAAGLVRGRRGSVLVTADGRKHWIAALSLDEFAEACSPEVVLGDGREQRERARWILRYITRWDAASRKERKDRRAFLGYSSVVVGIVAVLIWGTIHDLTPGNIVRSTEETGDETVSTSPMRRAPEEGQELHGWFGGTPEEEHDRGKYLEEFYALLQAGDAAGAAGLLQDALEEYGADEEFDRLLADVRDNTYVAEEWTIDEYNTEYNTEYQDFYDEAGLLLKEVTYHREEDDSLVVDSELVLEYDDHGNTVQILSLDAEGEIIQQYRMEYLYDEAGRVLEYQEEFRVPEKEEWSRDSHDQMQYDAAGRQIYSNWTDSGGHWVETTYTYEGEGTEPSEEIQKLQGVYGSAECIIQSTYDAEGRPLTRRSVYVPGEGNRGEEPQSVSTTEYRYDAKGNLVEKTSVTEWGAATGEADAPCSFEKTLFVYDDRNLLISSRTQDENGGRINELQYVYDALDKPVQSLRWRSTSGEADGADDGGRFELVKEYFYTYVYDGELVE